MGILFVIGVIAFTVKADFPGVSTRLWDLFGGTNAALFLALNIDTGNKPTSPPAVLVGA